MAEENVHGFDVVANQEGRVDVTGLEADIRLCTIYHKGEEVFSGPLDLNRKGLIRQHYGPLAYILYEDGAGITRDHVPKTY